MHSEYYLTLIYNIQIYNTFNFIQLKKIASNTFSEVLIMKKKIINIMMNSNNMAVYIMVYIIPNTEHCKLHWN